MKDVKKAADDSSGLLARRVSLMNTLFQIENDIKSVKRNLRRAKSGKLRLTVPPGTDKNVVPLSPVQTFEAELRDLAIRKADCEDQLQKIEEVIEIIV